LQEWNFEDKVVSATTDLGSNVKKCMAIYSTTSTSKCTWLLCAPHKIQIDIKKTWKNGGAEPFAREVPENLQTLQEQGFPGESSCEQPEENEHKSVSMGTTRRNSRYEMTRPVYKMRNHIAVIVKYFTDNPADLPSYINNDKVKNCLLSPEEVDTVEDIINLLNLEKASKYGNETGASTIPTT